VVIAGSFCLMLPVVTPLMAVWSPVKAVST
jgi:hypothetical protein